MNVFKRGQEVKNEVIVQLCFKNSSEENEPEVNV